eukprot:901890-Pelagomonas_calceolata.AAC.1
MMEDFSEETTVAMNERIIKACTWVYMGYVGNLQPESLAAVNPKRVQALNQLNWIGSIPHSRSILQKGVEVRISNMDFKNLKGHF